MEVSFSTTFKKAFNKRIKGSVSEIEFWNRLEIFISDPFNTKLKAHKLSGKLKGLWSFSIEQDIRVIFYFTKEKPKKVVFVDIGTHNEVY
jgi:addiction module RelE/StbE family toxin